MALTLTDELAAALLDALGLPADITDAALVVDTTKDLAAHAVSAAEASQPSQVAAAARHCCSANLRRSGERSAVRRAANITLIGDGKVVESRFNV